MSDPRPRVLIVDDIEENVIALEALLKRLKNIEIMTAPSGPAALELLLVHDFALALLDVNMPEMDGFQLAEVMRGTQRTRAIPIIFVTAAYEPQRVFRGYETGAVDYLIKPVEPRMLLSKVQTFITLHEQTLRLGESLRLHETFVAALNHDLRAPINTISLGAAILADAKLGTREHGVVHRIQTAALRATALLDDLYDLARMRLGAGIILERTHGDLAHVVGDVVREAELRSTEHKLALDTRGDATGEWDLSRISRIATNLVSNALMHGDQRGTIEVAIDGSQPDAVTLAVHNGGSIPTELLPRIFEPFRRGTHRSEGLGLGLYIVRELASAHGGAVSVTSTPDAGTRFEVWLPRRAS